MMAHLRLLVAFSLCLQVQQGRGALMPLTEENKQSIVDAHNKYRDDAAATAMRKMKWNDELAQFASTAAGRCNFHHTDYKSRQNVAGFSYIGENIYTTAGAIDQPTVNVAVDDWASEQKDYDITSNSCSAVCGHYTQIVWGKTSDVGCAVAQCDSIGGFSSDPGYVIFCNYGPGGNIIGEGPYEKAGSESEVGSKCQQMFKGTADEHGLCVAGEGSGTKDNSVE